MEFADFKIMAHAIAKSIEAEAKINEEYCCNVANIYGNGYGLHIREGGYQLKGRVSISGIYPTFEGHINLYDAKLNDSMTVVNTKTAPAIAKEITRKVLSNVKANTALTQAKIDELKSAKNGLSSAISELIELCGGDARKYKDDTIMWYGDNTVMEIRLSQDGKGVSDCKIRQVSLEGIKKVIEVLK